MRAKQDLALLVLRIFSGLILMQFGLAKAWGGRFVWGHVGAAMRIFGIRSGFIFWGQLAVFSELVGGGLVMVGFCTRVASAFLLFTMIVATLFNLKLGTHFAGLAFPLELCGVFLTLLLSGPGRFSLDKQ